MIFTILDIHTAPPSPDFKFPGTVITQATGSVNMMVIALNSDDDVVLYVGPVFLHSGSSEEILR